MTDERVPAPDPNDNAFLDSFPVGCLVTDPDRAIRYANGYLRDLLDCADEELIGAPLCRFLTGGSVALLETYIVPLLARYGRFEEILLQVTNRSGHAVPVIVNGWRVGTAGNTHWAIVSAIERDKLYDELISARRSLEERASELSTRAATDFLTGLLARGEFERHVERAVAHAVRGDRSMTLLIVDVDDFKGLNDRRGHRAGDEFLQRIGPLLQNAVRTCDLVARYGGDEFAILVIDAAVEEAASVAHRINRDMRALEIGDDRLTASVGAATARGGAEPTLPELFELADRALYEAKHRGRDQAVVRSYPEDAGADERHENTGNAE